MACCLTIPSHNLNQWWIIREVLWHSPEANFRELKISFLDMTLNITNLRLQPQRPWANDLTPSITHKVALFCTHSIVLMKIPSYQCGHSCCGEWLSHNISLKCISNILNDKLELNKLTMIFMDVIFKKNKCQARSTWINDKSSSSKTWCHHVAKS